MTKSLPSSGKSTHLNAVRAPWLDRLRIRHLRLLELIAEHGSLSAAAQQLALSQPAATQMLHELEGAFRVELVTRTTRGAVLTPTGLVALERLRIALNALGAAAVAIEEAPLVPVVRLGVLPLVGVAALPRLLAAITARSDCPRLIVQESTVDGLFAMLGTGELDCVIGRIGSRQEATATSNVLVTPLWEERLTIACALDHPVGQRRTVGLAELRELEWIVAPRGAYIRQAFEEPFLAAGIVPPLPSIESFSFHTNLCMVAKSRLLTAAPKSAVRHYEGLGMVRSVRHDLSFPAGRAVFITREDMTASPSVMLIRTALLELVQDEVWGGGQ
ncbi:LysR family transcriptional regulator [Pseudomonas sp. NPDC089530]|uniref:LysR family transcriptional regulator n=1 Tax=Pseudomonas sp. NPDC089530 TaxID=3390651 RepID=UPI003D00A33C